jgi:DNA polymerase-3 subunit delta'
MPWDIIGHEWAANLLSEQAARREERHAYLFTGPPGVGRRTMALRFAQALNCLQPPAPGQPCRACRICAQIERMQHADLFVVQAEQEGGILKVDQIRSLQHSLALAPYEARYKIALLLRFHEANANAANALLKTLEEAPSRAVLLLTADTPEALLPTIVSRCEVLRLRPMPVDALAAHMPKEERVLAEQARLLAHLSGGRVGYARRLLASPSALDRRQAWIEEAFRLLREPHRERFIYAEKIAKDKDKDLIRQVMLNWLSFWRDVMICAAGADTPLVNIDHEEELRALAGSIDLESARAMVGAAENGLRRLDANVNPRLLAEVLLMDWPRVSR